MTLSRKVVFAELLATSAIGQSKRACC